MFDILDGASSTDIQSILFSEYLDALVAAIDGKDCVLAGGAVTAQGTPDMTVAVAKASILSAGVLKPVTAGNVTIGAAHATLPRLDLIVADSTGAKQVRAGTAAAAPKPPARTANDVLLAVVYVPAADTTIGASQINDLRVMRTQGPITVHKVTTPFTTTPGVGIQTLDSVVLPSGLLLAGKSLHWRGGGTILANSGTPTFTFTITYGGTTLYAEVSVASVADVDRHGWYLQFDLVAQGNSDQFLLGTIVFRTDSLVAPPVTGISGDFAAINRVYAPVAAGTVDSDAADRTLQVQVTMSVNNAAVETVLEFAEAVLS